jgi:non-haem Fe2+, alpha-ketoglutarate-dependent halogenase
MHGTSSQSLVETYRRDGIVFPIDVLPPARSVALRRTFEELERNRGGSPEPARWTHLCFPWAYDLTIEPAVLDAVEALIGPEIIAWGSIILCKHPGHRGYVPWHQDSPHPEAKAAPSVSAWIALADSNPANGCMRVIPGTHRELLPHHDRPDPDNLVRSDRILSAAVEESQARDVVLSAGEMSLHHELIVHGSNPNHGSDKRIGFVVRYTTPATRSRGFPVIRARGTADCPHLTFAGRPSKREPRDAFAAYLRFCDAMERKRQASRHH